MADNSSAEPPGDAAPVTLLCLPEVLIVEIVGHIVCHVGLAGLAGTNTTLRHLLLGVSASSPKERVECRYPSPSLVAERITALVDARGWIAFSGLAPLAPLDWRMSSRAYYSRRLASLPLPHMAWPLDSGGCERLVGARQRWPTVREALDAAKDGDTLRLDPGVFYETEPLVRNQII